MCTRTDHDGACEDCARTDTWLDLTAAQRIAANLAAIDHEIREAAAAFKSLGDEDASASTEAARNGDLSDDRADQEPTDPPTLKPGDRVAVRWGDAARTFTVPRSRQESDMTTQTRHDELVALLSRISEESVTTSNVLADVLDLLRERLPEGAKDEPAPAFYDPDLAARNLDAIKHELETPVGEHGECCEPAGVTEGQPVVTRIVDRDGDVWERREEGWSLWHSSEWVPWRGHGRWPQPPGNGILRPATPSDLARVGIEDEHAPQADPDTVTLRREDVAALLDVWEEGDVPSSTLSRRVREAAGWSVGWSK